VAKTPPTLKRDGVPAYDSNFLGLRRTTIVAAGYLAPGKVPVQLIFVYRISPVTSRR
jgi:hypothetical protein